MFLQIFTGNLPFHGLNDLQIVDAIDDGKRPERPNLDECELPDRTWTMMKECWDSDPRKRPSALSLYLNI